MNNGIKNGQSCIPEVHFSPATHVILYVRFQRRISKSQIRNSLSHSAIAKPHIFMLNSQIRKFLQNTAKRYLKTVRKVVLVNVFYVCKNLNLEHYMLFFKLKYYVFAGLWKFQVRKSQERLG
jgi:hypothetical protein